MTQQTSATTLGDRLFALLMRYARLRNRLVPLKLRVQHAEAANVGDPPPPSATDPAYYKAMIPDVISAQPYPPLPLDPIEKMPQGEHNHAKELAELTAAAVIDSFCTALALDPVAIARRDVHVKESGFVRASFNVEPTLAPQFALGIFQPGKQYPALLRFSNGSSELKPDRKPDAHGLAIKLSQVPGTPILPTGQPPEQDFLLSSYPVFPFGTAATYVVFQRFSALKSARRWAYLRAALNFLAWTIRHWNWFVIFVSTLLVGARNPLDVAYYGMSPYRLGRGHVVRYIVRSTSPNGNGDTAAPDFLRAIMAKRLAPPNQPVTLDFLVQLRANATTADAEDASKRWTRPGDIEILLAKIVIPAQSSADPAALYQGDALSFSPWNCLLEHRPLGGLNRSRLMVYRASKEMRRRLNAGKP